AEAFDDEQRRVGIERRAAAVVDTTENTQRFRNRAHAVADSEVDAAEQAEDRDVGRFGGKSRVGEVELAAAEHVDHSKRSWHVPGAPAVMAGKYVDDGIGFFAGTGRRIDANTELGFLLRRVLAVRPQIQIFRELDEALVRLRIERLVEAALE